MAKVSGDRPASFLSLSDVRVGGTYLAQNNKPYIVDHINGNHVVCNKRLKTGAVSRKFPVNGVYGYSLYFTEEIEPPPRPVVDRPQDHWTHEGRTLYRDGKEMFSLHRKDNLSPVDMDQLTRLIMRMLNAVERD